MAVINSRNRLVKDKMKQKTFVLDLDGTLCDIDSVFFKTAYALSYFGLEIDESFMDEREHITLADAGIVSEEDELRILTLFDIFRVWENLEPFPGVREFLQEISSNGNSIVYLTSRRSVLRKQTTNWLVNNKFPRPPDSEFGNENPVGKVTLMMNGPRSKSDHLKRILGTLPSKDIFYFENDPFYVKEACKLGFRNVYTFKESYILCHDLPDGIKLLEKPKNNAYHRLDKSIFK